MREYEESAFNAFLRDTSQLDEIRHAVLAIKRDDLEKFRGSNIVIEELEEPNQDGYNLIIHYTLGSKNARKLIDFFESRCKKIGFFFVGTAG